MKVTMWKPVTVEVTAIRAIVPVRYEEELEELEGCPGLEGSTLTLTFGLDGGRVQGWDGKARGIHLKVCDEGRYELLGADGDVVAVKDDGYVPRCFPQEYGDYLIAAIAEDGSVKGPGGHPWAPRLEAIKDVFASGGAA